MNQSTSSSQKRATQDKQGNTASRQQRETWQRRRRRRRQRQRRHGQRSAGGTRGGGLLHSMAWRPCLHLICKRVQARAAAAGPHSSSTSSMVAACALNCDRRLPRSACCRQSQGYVRKVSTCWGATARWRWRWRWQCRCLPAARLSWTRKCKSKRGGSDPAARRR